MQKRGDRVIMNWRRRILIAAASVLFVFSLAVLSQNRTGHFLRSEIILGPGDVKKSEGRAFRIPIKAASKSTSRKLIHESVVLENGQRLEKAPNVRSVQGSGNGIFATTDNGIWVNPQTGNVENLVLKIPRLIPWWISLPLYGITIGLLLWLIRLGVANELALWYQKVSGGRLKRLWAAINRYPSAPLLASGVFMLGVFQNFVLSDVAPFYPRYSDQNLYLSAAYDYADQARDHGWWVPFTSHFFSGRMGGLIESSPNQNLPFVVSYFLYVFGNSRLNALFIHILSWVLLLGVIYWCFKKMTGKAGFGWLAVGLLTFTHMPMVGAGGIADFRLDFVAACWMGISVAFWCLFLFQPKSLYAWLGSGSVAILVFVRLISAASIGVALAFILGLALFTFLSKKRIELRRALPPLISVGVWTLLLVIANYKFIYNYYFKLSLETELASRGADETFKHGVWEAVRYYPESLFFGHFGQTALGLLIATILGFAGYSLWTGRKRSVAADSTGRKSAIIFAALSAVIPLIVLTANPHRISHVAGIAVVPFVVLGMLFITSVSILPKKRIISIVGFLVLFVGTTSWGVRLKKSAPFPGSLRRDAEVINMVFAEITLNLRGLPPTERTLAVLDFLEASSAIWYYGRERLNSSNYVTCTFPNQITRMETHEIVTRIKEVSAVIAPRDSSILRKRPYHISESLRVSFDEMMKTVREEFTIYSSFTYQGNRYDLYLNPHLSGFSEDTKNIQDSSR